MFNAHDCLSTNCPSFTAANQVTLTRRVTGSTCCRSVQFSSCAVNDRTSLNAIVAYACLHTVQSVKHCQQLKNGYYDLRTCNMKETSIAVMICCRKTDISPSCFPFTFCYGITTWIRWQRVRLFKRHKLTKKASLFRQVCRTILQM